MCLPHQGLRPKEHETWVPHFIYHNTMVLYVASTPTQSGRFAFGLWINRFPYDLKLATENLSFCDKHKRALNLIPTWDNLLILLAHCGIDQTIPVWYFKREKTPASNIRLNSYKLVNSLWLFRFSCTYMYPPPIVTRVPHSLVHRLRTYVLGD